MKKGILFLSATLLLLFFAAGCKKTAEGSVVLNMKHYVDGEEMELNVIKYLTASGHVYGVENLKYYISDVKLVREDGRPFELLDYQLTDIHEPGSETVDIDNVVPGDYTMFSFTFGLTPARNTRNGLENTLANINMVWPETLGDSGYHYMKYEGRYDSLGTGVMKTFAVHTGPTFDNNNSIQVELPGNITIEEGSNEINIMMDLAEWIRNPNEYDFDRSASAIGIMADQPVQEIIKANGATVFSVQVN